MHMMKFVINRKIFISMLFTALVLLGVVSYNQLDVELYPNAELPFLIVQARTMQELDPAYVESQAIIPLEGVVSSLEGVDTIESYVERNGGMIFVYFNQNVNVKYLYLRLDEKVNAVKSEIGEEFIISVQKVDTESLSNTFMSLQVRGTGDVDRIRQIVEERMLADLQNVDGVANVSVFGGREKSIEIILDEQACKAYRITPNSIRNLIAQNNQIKTFVGKAYTQNRYYFVNVNADYTDVSQIENIIVRDEGPVYLRDVAEIYFGLKEETSLSRVNGKEAITVQLTRESQSNLIELAGKTRKVVADLNDELVPLGIDVVIQSDTAENIEENINMIIKLAITGALLAVFVLWVFLRNLRWVLVITLAIPISVYTAFNFFYAGDVTINSLTLVGMALAVGMLLDNSVVVMENIYRLLSKRDRDDAVIQGTSEVWRSIFAATLTTVTVFVPFVFAENFLVRLMGRHIGVSIISTLLVSLVVALFLIPMLTHLLIKQNSQNREPASLKVVSHKNRLMQIYRVILKACMRFPARTVIGGILLFFVSLLIALIVSINVPQEDESRQFDVYLTMAEGATFDKTDLVVNDMESQLEGLEEIEEVVSKIYEEEAIVTIKLQEDFEKIDKRSLDVIKDDVDDRLESIQTGDISFEQPTSSQRFRGGGGRNPGAGFERMLGIGMATESVIIKGRNYTVMRNLAEDINEYLSEMDAIQRSNVSVASERPEVHLYLDQLLMNQYSITPQNVTSELAGFQSEFNSNLTFKDGTEEYDIIIRMGDEEEEDEDKTIDDLVGLDITSTTGDLYELEDFSQIVLSEGRASINRVNQERQVEVNYSFIREVTDSRDVLEASRLEVDDLIANLNIPSGIAVEVVHEDNDLSDFTFLLIAAFILIFMILAAVFESFSTPFVMMFTIPLAAIGSLWALILTGNSLLNANTLIGFLILLGIVVNNGIIYIDYTRILRSRGYSRSRALMMAGMARVRPILITAITTIIAMMPLALGNSEYVKIIGAPFAITVIGGLALSTLFTLVFIPTFYSGLENALKWLRELDFRIQLAQICVFLAAAVLIYLNVFSILWRVIWVVTVVIIIPAATWFIINSLRTANEKMVDQDDELSISIRKIIKIYDQPARIVREWTKGIHIRERAGMQKEYKSWRDFDDYIWQIPVLAFLIYFTYFYLSGFFWSFILSHFVFFFLLYLEKPMSGLLIEHRPKLAAILHRLLFWGFPVLNLIYFYLTWEKLGTTIFITVLWFLALAVYTTSNRLQREKINIARITGRFSGLRRAFYRFVQIIPIIGKKRTPFRALNGVSLEIGSGMFGLLGPNGAGKTTLMRTICGILEQSRGKIYINGMDLNVYREEFQGIIGYLPQDFGMYENMSAHDYLDYQSMLKGLSDPQAREQRIQQVLESVHMVERQHERISSFSGGMKQRIGIAQTLLHLPRILVVDEPTAGLDPRERIRFRNLLVDLSRERIVIFSTHIIEDISSSCNKVAVLNKGELRYVGEPVQMAKLAEGQVWQFLVPVHEFEDYQKQYKVLHHMRVKDQIRVRCMADTQPTPEAIAVQPTLEDAYLYLLKDNAR